MRSTTLAAAALAVVCLVVTGCASSPASRAEAPASARSLDRVAGRTDSASTTRTRVNQTRSHYCARRHPDGASVISRGHALAASPESVFQHSCGLCHPGGAADIGPRISDRNLSEAAVRRQVREGSTLMSPLSEDCLSNAELDTAMEYLRQIHTVR